MVAGRILVGVMTGIGFIGGGSILKEGTSVHGTATAASRFTSQGARWVRRDGVPIVEKASDLAQGKLIAPIAVVFALLSQTGAFAAGNRDHRVARDHLVRLGQQREARTRKAGVDADDQSVGGARHL